MAVRIALQCSEADAHLILSEDNTAARLLTRPGEAIYNDANGLHRGEQPLPGRLALRRAARGVPASRSASWPRPSNRPPATPIVFEGNLPADRRARTRCSTRCSKPPAWPEPPRLDQAWLGDAIAIKDPTAAVFRRQSGSNLLIVGQNDEAALAMLMMAGAEHRRPASATAAQAACSSTCSTAARSTRRSPASSAKLGRLHPPPGQERRAARAAPGSIGEIAAEVERRQRPGRRGTGPDLPVDLRPPAVPRPPQGRRRLRLLLELRRGQARLALEVVQRPSSRKARPSASTPSSGATA